jgi:hypothetical protein
VDQTSAIARFVHALGAGLADLHHRGDLQPPAPAWRIAENRWSALRDGVGGELLDLRTGDARPTGVDFTTLSTSPSPTLGAAWTTYEPWSNILRSTNSAPSARIASSRGSQRSSPDEVSDRVRPASFRGFAPDPTPGARTRPGFRAWLHSAWPCAVRREALCTARSRAVGLSVAARADRQT